MYAPPSVRGTVVMPGFLGGMEWGGVGWDPESQLVVTNVNNLATVATLIRRDSLARVEPRPNSTLASQDPAAFGVRREVLLSPLGLPCTPPPWGTLAAVDLATGAVRWQVPLGTVRDLARIPTPGAWGSPNLGGPLVTGGLVFIGSTMDRGLRAFDLATGAEVWSDALPASAQATPMTYRASPGGRQYIVVAAGGHDAMRSALGDHVVAYALGGERAWATRSGGGS
jgi:quinoprotein glucose dehydrogenase